MSKESQTLFKPRHYTKIPKFAKDKLNMEALLTPINNDLNTPTLFFILVCVLLVQFKNKHPSTKKIVLFHISLYLFGVV